MTNSLRIAQSRRWLWGLLALALLVRAGWAIVLQHQLDHRWHRPFLIEGDANGYWELGKKLAHGEPYAIYAPPRYVLRMPGFPAFLALSMELFGERTFPARALLVLLGTIACGLVYLLGRRLFDRETGLIACGCAAVLPTIVGFTPLILSETLFALVLLAGLVSASWLAAELTAAPENRSLTRTLGWGLATGGLISAACYVRPSWLLWAAVLAAVAAVHALRGTQTAAARKRKQAVAAAVAILLGTVLPLIPWGLRNQQVTGHFVLTTLWLGPSLYDGLNPQATGDSDMTFFDRDNLLSQMSEYEVDQAYRRRAWEFVRTHPGQTLRLAAVKFLRYWNPFPNADQFSSVWVRAAVAAGFVPMALFALVGLWQHRRRTWAILLSAGPILYFCALHLVFVSSLRYRLPAEYPLLVLSAAGLRSLWRRPARQ